MLWNLRPEAFEKHEKVCTVDSPGGPLGQRKGGATPSPRSARATPSPRSAGTTPSPRLSGKPRGYTCYLCGQQYGSRRWVTLLLLSAPPWAWCANCSSHLETLLWGSGACGKLTLQQLGLCLFELLEMWAAALVCNPLVLWLAP